MDWLEDLFENVKSYMKKVSLKKAMCVYILIAMIFVVILWVITVNICKGWQNVILSSYGID